MIQHKHEVEVEVKEKGDKSGNIDMFLWFYLLNFK